jgi:hypothetical protein
LWEEFDLSHQPSAISHQPSAFASTMIDVLLKAES